MDDRAVAALGELFGAIEDSDVVMSVLHNAAPYDRKEHRVRHALMAAEEALTRSVPQQHAHKILIDAATTRQIDTLGGGSR